MASFTDERYMDLATEIYLHLIRESGPHALLDFELRELAKRADDAAAALADRFLEE
jgi:hypothetical protein